MVGSPIYMAPEILKGCNYNIKADIWSMGVVLFEMLFGYCPFEDKTIARLIAQIDTKPLNIPRHINNISPKVEEILHRMLTVDPNKRIEWNALLSSPLFERAPLQDKTTSTSVKNSNCFDLLWYVALFFKLKTNYLVFNRIKLPFSMLLRLNRFNNNSKYLNSSNSFLHTFYPMHRIA